MVAVGGFIVPERGGRHCSVLDFCFCKHVVLLGFVLLLLITFIEFGLWYWENKDGRVETIGLTWITKKVRAHPPGVVSREVEVENSAKRKT